MPSTPSTMPTPHCGGPQDRVALATNWQDSGSHLLGVYDGHGPNGHHVAEFVHKATPPLTLTCASVCLSGHIYIFDHKAPLPLITGSTPTTSLHAPCGAQDLPTALARVLLQLPRDAPTQTVSKAALSSIRLLWM